VKRGKTRRTRRKTRTVHRGGLKWKFWKKDNEVAPEPTITLEQVKKYLEDKSLLTTLECLTKELENRRTLRQTEIHLCDAPPCDSNTQPVAAAQHSLSIELIPIEPLNGWTKEKPNRNGWYIEVQHDRDGNITSIQNDNLKKMSDGPGTGTGTGTGNINNFGNSKFGEYMKTINDLPNPSYSYSTIIDGTKHTFSLRSSDVGSELIWYENETNPMVRIIDTISYNPENPLTINFKNKKYTLTKVE
jgi:hypothetical protein